MWEDFKTTFPEFVAFEALRKNKRRNRNDAAPIVAPVTQETDESVTESDDTTHSPSRYPKRIRYAIPEEEEESSDSANCTTAIPMTITDKASPQKVVTINENTTL